MTTTETITFTLDTSAGTRKLCMLCGRLVDKLEEAAYGDDGRPCLDDVRRCIAYTVCLDCVAAGEAAMRAKAEESLARHRAKLAWLRAQATLDRAQFAAQVAKAEQDAAVLAEHITEDEAALAAPWQVPSREAIAAYLVERHREYQAQRRPGEESWWTPEDDAEYAESIRKLTGVTVTF